MATIVQLLIAVVLGVLGWFLTDLAGAPDPWPIVVGVIVFLVCLGMSVFILDSDAFDI